MKYCPTQSGTFTGFRPQWRMCGGKDWIDIRIKTNQESKRVLPPYPSDFGGILKTIVVFGYSQAMAIAWEYSAFAEARGEHIEVGVASYEITYDIKAMKLTSKVEKGENEKS